MKFPLKLVTAREVGLDKFCRQNKGPFTQAIFVAQLNAIFVAPKLQLRYRTCKPAAISARFYRRDIAGVSNLFET